MKHIFELALSAGILAVALLSENTLSAESTIAGNDKNITFTGRTLQKNKTTQFNWSGVTMIVRFSGTSLSLDADDSKTNYYNVWVDSPVTPVAQRILKLGGKTTLAENLPDGEHTVIVQKRTEGEQGTITIKSLTTDGTFLKAASANERRIEFIGDSYTCGYGTESKSGREKFKPETENCNQAYACIIGRFFDADVQLVSHSGRGIVRNYDDYNPELTMTNMYFKTLDGNEGPDWNKDDFKPALVVIYLGTNDFSCGKQPALWSWNSNYIRLLGQVRKVHPGVPVLCVASKADPLLAQYVASAAGTSGLKDIHWAAIQENAHNDSSELGASSHPNYEGQRKVASIMIPYISTITGWAMPHKIIE